MRKRFTHDPDCDTIRKDLTLNGVAPPCTCRSRQRARLKCRPAGTGGDWAAFAQTHESIGHGNYRAYTPAGD